MVYRHHQSICNQRVPPIKPDAQEPAAPAKEGESANGSITKQPIQNQVESPKPSAHTVHVQSTTATSSTNTKGHVMLQTATAIATNEDGSKSARVKILFDSGSQCSYITNGLKSRLNIKPKKTEILHLNTFGASRNVKYHHYYFEATKTKIL